MTYALYALLIVGYALEMHAILREVCSYDD